MNNISNLLERAKQSFSWTSFDPEKRGTQFIEEISENLNSDIEQLTKYGATDEDLQRYCDKFYSIVSAWIGAKSNCASSFITGGSGFNTRRAEKANNREHAHSENFYSFRDKVLASYKKAAERAKKDEKIEAAGGEAALMREQLEKAKADHEWMKNVNKVIRKLKKAEEVAAALNCSVANAQELLKPDFCGRIGVPQYRLTNNLANIKRMEQRVKELEAKEARKESAEQVLAHQGNGWQLIQNNEVDRLQFIFEGKPSDDVRILLKSNGFKWAPSQNAWQRQITNNAIFSTRHLLPKLKELLAA